MASSAADYFNTKARPTMFDLHGEGVTLTDPNEGSGGISTLTVVWQRVAPLAPDEDGLGLTAYSGEATACVRLTDLPANPGPNSIITREGEEWYIRYVEPKDAFTKVLHLARRKRDVRLPQRSRG